MFESAVGFLNRERCTDFKPVSESLYEGFVVVGNERFKLSIDLGKGFPNDFPIIQVLESKKFHPHATFEGPLCLLNKEEVIVKEGMENELLLDSYDRAIEILDMDPQEQKKEILREFSVYWEIRSVLGVRLYLNLPDAKEHEYQEYIAIGPSPDRLVVSGSIEESKVLLANNMQCPLEKTETIRMICTRIRLREPAVPPRMNGQFTWRSIRAYIQDNITGGQKRQFEKLLSIKTRKVNRMVIIVIPSDEGDQHACFWVHSNESKKPMSIKNTLWSTVDAVATSRIDLNYMLARGGAETGLRDKSVLLIGAGSVGGFLAENLCQCGVGALDILDKDKLSVDNVHRHVLGFNDAMTGEYKADLLKMRLESRFPYVEIDSLNFTDRSVESFLKDPERLLGYDLVISATGNPTVDLVINDVLHEFDDRPPFIVCFNEPYGIGGHAIAILNTGACLRCLYSDPISGETVPFLGSFVRSDQSFSKTMSGCAGSFVDYSVLDSQQTAILATRLSIDVLRGECGNSRIISWLGPSDKLMQAGFKTSEFFEELWNTHLTSIIKDVPRNERCRICGS